MSDSTQAHDEYFERYRRLGETVLREAAESLRETSSLARSAARADERPEPIASPRSALEEPVQETRSATPAERNPRGTSSPDTGGGEAPLAPERADPPTRPARSASVTNRILARGPTDTPRTSDQDGAQQLVNSLRRRVLGANTRADTSARPPETPMRVLGGRDGALARFRRRRFGE